MVKVALGIHANRYAGEVAEILFQLQRAGDREHVAPRRRQVEATSHRDGFEIFEWQFLVGERRKGVCDLPRGLPAP